MTDIITKKITDLTATNSFDTGDLMLVRKTGENFDRKITKSDLVESIGNPAISGFKSFYVAQNQVRLEPTNGAEITEYKQGMNISFFVPNGAYNPNANFSIKINDLGFISIKQYGTETPIKPNIGQYITAVFDTDTGVFHQTNNSNDSNSSIEYTVTGTGTNIVLTTINGVPKNAYYDGMTISFITKHPANTNVVIAVDDLVTKPLINQVGQAVTNLIAGQPILAVYNSAANSFVTSMQVNQVVTNEYNVASTEILSNPDRTIFNLVSVAGSLPKHVVFGNYYEGMTAIFTVKFDDLVRIRSNGAVFVKIDEFADMKLLTDPDGDAIANDVLAGQTILAKYDGTKFIKNRFAVEVDDGFPEFIEEPIVPPEEDPLDPNYQGDPRDPANTLNENALDGQDRRIFDIVLTVSSTGGNFTTVRQAINQIVRDYGGKGERLNGKKIALVLSNLGLNPDLSIYENYNCDLRFITIFSQNNNIITTNKPIYVNTNYSPIFNFKLNINTPSNYSGFYGLSNQIDVNGKTTFTFGKNVTINFAQNEQNIRPLIGYICGIIAPYGLVLNINSIGLGSCNYIYLNKANITIIHPPEANISSYLTIKDSNSSVLANTIFTIISSGNKSGIGIDIRTSKTLIRNVTATTRPTNNIFIRTADSDITIRSSNLARTGGTIGYWDINANGNSRLNYIRKDAATTGTLNQAIGQETSLGTIILEQ